MTKTTKRIVLILILIALSACASPGTSPPELTITATPPLPSATATQIPTPSPTPLPEERASEGDQALLVGDYESALKIFQETLTQTSDPLVIARSQLGLGQAYFEQKNYAAGRDQLRAAAASDDPVVAGRAQYLLGKTYTRLERYQEALAAYDAYLDLRPGVLDSHVYELRADLFTILNDLDQAIVSLEQAYRTDPYGGSESLSIKIAVAYENSGDQDTALGLYQNIYDSSESGYTKAQMDLRIGRIYLSRQDPEQAYPYFQDAVANYPFAYDAYTALVTLVEADVPVNEYQRGLINYNMGNHALAIEAFDRYLQSGVETFADAVLYYKALATRAGGAGNGVDPNQAAIALWEDLIKTYPTSAFYVDAWEDIEFTLWAYLGEPQQAAEHALRFVAQRPESEQAPSFLFLAGRSYERADLLREAADTWARIANEYPDSEMTFQAVYFAGIAHVRLGDWAGAQPLFARALVLTSEPAQIAAANLWIGKCREAEGEIGAALDSYKLAQTADPFGHYSIRAEELLRQWDVFRQPNKITLDPDLSPYRMEAEAWLRATFNLPADTNLESPGLLANDPRFQRGLELWSLGNYPAGKAEFEAMRNEFANDPAQTFRLIPALVEIGLYRTALVASTELLKSAGLTGADALEAPEFFSRIRFGAYYLDWVLPIAESENLSPLILLSVMRQESAYEGFIRSGAGARGLMQILPTTGAQLSTQLNWPENYTEEDLYRPYVSLKFGASYLRQQRQLFESDLFAMLAAYNGGPGNTLAWKALTPIEDPDLFLEIVRIEETRNYIRLINEIHAIYRWLYGDSIE